MSGLVRKQIHPWYRAIWGVIGVNPVKKHDFDYYHSTVFRAPTPGSPTTMYQRPETSNSNIVKNYYFNRDTRRNDLGKPKIISVQTLLAAASATPAEVTATSTSIPLVGVQSNPVVSEDSFYSGPRLGTNRRI